MMDAPTSAFSQHQALARRHPVVSYFVLAFAISWAGAFAVVAPSLLRGQTVPKFAGLMMFPVMMLGPSLAGVFMTWRTDGRRGLRDLFSRVVRLQVPVRWYAGLLIAPTVMLCVLLSLANFISPVYWPNHFLVGASFGVVAGFFEEIGWTGYVFPKMLGNANALISSVFLGVLWACWHLPVIDYLGTATPHGSYWFRYFLAFAAAMMAVRVLIGWIYTNTTSVALAQLMHATSTGALVVLSPQRVTAAQEALWYAVYAGILWIVVMLVVVLSKSRSVLRFFRRVGSLPASLGIEKTREKRL
jgi:membrane protease YdiL (CAAX protease family)